MQVGDNIGLGDQTTGEVARISARTSAGIAVLEGLRAGDSVARVRLWDSSLEFGPGTTEPDTVLLRTAFGAMSLSGTLNAESFTSQHASPGFTLYETTATANHRKASWLHSGGSLIGRLYTDDGATSEDWLSLTRSGSSPGTLSLRNGRMQVLGTSPNLILNETDEAGDLWGIIAGGGSFAISRFDRSTLAFKSNAVVVTTAGVLQVGGSTVYHQGNDGHGGGLDADTLDGLHGADYALAGHTHSYEPSFSKGSLIQGSGVTLTGTLTGRLVGSGDITIAASGAGTTNLDGLTDVTISAPVAGQFLKYAGSQWVNSSHGLTYSDVGASPVGHNHDTEYARLSGAAQTVSAATTFDTGLKITGMGSDISGSGDWRAIVRDQSSNGLRTMTAAFMRSWLDASQVGHGHSISDVSGLQTALDGKLSNAATGVSAGSYGDASVQSVPYFTVNAQGQITAAASRNITAADLGASATLVFVTTTEVNFTGGQLTDGTYRTALGSIRSPLSTTLSAGALASGYVLRLEAFGMFAGNDGYTPKLRVKVGSSYTVEFQIDEPNSASMLSAGAWSAVVNLLVVTSGSSATVISRGHFDVGAPNSGASDYVLRTKPTISGTLNTTVSNAIAVDFAGSANVTEFRCSSVVVTII